MKTKLTPKQSAFIKHKLADPTASNTEIAKRAGYAPSSAYQRGYELVKDSEIREKLDRLVDVGLDTLEDIAINGKVEIARVASAKVLVETGLGKPKANNQNDFGDLTINIMRLDPTTLKTIPVKLNH